jgi:replication-associated recombination protein RarA
MTNPEQFLWVEKYRPQKISECILPVGLESTFQSIVRSGEIPNMIFSGTAGCGKTTVAKALCKEIDSDFLFINGSESGNIDTLRTTVRDFASSVSLTNSKKTVILDEADYLNPSSTQPALRGFIEEFANNCRFVLTCNYKNRIIEPLHSRCSVIDFRIPSKEKPILAKKMFERAKEILTAENITFDQKVLLEVVVKYFPDYRRVLGELQRYSNSGQIDSGILSRYTDFDIKPLIDSMKAKNYTEIRKWISLNTDMEPATIFRKIYDGLSQNVEPASIPAVIMILGEHQYRMAFSADPEICLAACMAEILLNATFK